MPVLTILGVLIVVGFLLWLVNRYVPMDGKIKKILNVVAVILVVLWLLDAMGIMRPLRGIRVGVRGPQAPTSLIVKR